MNNFTMAFENKKTGKSNDNAHKIKHFIKQEINYCVQKGVKKTPKKHNKNNDSISNEGTNAISKFRSLSISDDNSNDKGKPTRY
eukprot:2288990-Ditylum_brightwellii.AAC.1